LAAHEPGRSIQIYPAIPLNVALKVKAIAELLVEISWMLFDGDPDGLEISIALGQEY
jgi:hypothetical protein